VSLAELSEVVDLAEAEPRRDEYAEIQPVHLYRTNEAAAAAEGRQAAMNLKEALESAPVQSYIQEMVNASVAETVGAQVSAIRSREAKRAKDLDAHRRQLDRLRGGRRNDRSPDEVAESMGVLETLRWGGERAVTRAETQRAGMDLPADGGACRNGQTRGMRVLEAMQQRQDPDEPVREPLSGRVLEAAVAAVPVENRGWRERMLMRGISTDVIEALGGRAA
jgi:hypothetical protein